MKQIERQFWHINMCPNMIADYGTSFICKFRPMDDPCFDPCDKEDWQSCPHNKPEPVKEWRWTIRPYNGPQATTDRYYTDEEIEDFSMINGRHVGYLCIKDSERIRD